MMNKKTNLTSYALLNNQIMWVSVKKELPKQSGIYDVTIYEENKQGSDIISTESEFFAHSGKWSIEHQGYQWVSHRVLAWSSKKMPYEPSLEELYEHEGLTEQG